MAGSTGRQVEPARTRHRDALVSRLPAEEQVVELAGSPTTLLAGGQGPPMVLLHGPGESSLWWMRVVPDLVAEHRVIVPDLPGHGASGLPEPGLDEATVLAWLDALIQGTCDHPPVLVGHLVGGAIAARYAAEHPDRVDRLVLVDTLGLRWFRPSPRFAIGLVWFMARTTEAAYGRFLDQCMLDQDGLQADMGELWEPFLAYNLACARSEQTKTAMGALMTSVGVPAIPAETLEAIQGPTALVWGSHDKATPVKVAKAASRAYGWPLHVIEHAGDDPKMEEPEAFLGALGEILAAGPGEVA